MLYMVIGHLHIAVTVICLKWLAAFAAWGQRWSLVCRCSQNTDGRCDINHKCGLVHTAHSTKSQHVCLRWEGLFWKTDHHQESEMRNLQEVGRWRGFVHLRPYRGPLIWSRRLNSRVCTTQPCGVQTVLLSRSNSIRICRNFSWKPPGYISGGENRRIKPMMSA